MNIGMKQNGVSVEMKQNGVSVVGNEYWDEAKRGFSRDEAKWGLYWDEAKRGFSRDEAQWGFSSW